MAAWQARVDGGGVRALRAFLLAQLPTAQQKEQLTQMIPSGDQNDDNSEAAALSPAQLRQCALWLREIRVSGVDAPTLRSLLSQRGGARVTAPSTTPEEEPSAARKKYLARRREKLLRLDEEMRYGHLVKNVQTTRESKELQRSLKSVKQHLSIGANMVVSRIVAFIVIYIVSGPLTNNQTTRIICGLGGAIGMMVIEMVLFIARAAKYDAIEREQKKHREGVF